MEAESASFTAEQFEEKFPKKVSPLRSLNARFRSEFSFRSFIEAGLVETVFTSAAPPVAALKARGEGDDDDKMKEERGSRVKGCESGDEEAEEQLEE